MGFLGDLRRQLVDIDAGRPEPFAPHGPTLKALAKKAGYSRPPSESVASWERFGAFLIARIRNEHPNADQVTVLKHAETGFETHAAGLPDAMSDAVRQTELWDMERGEAYRFDPSEIFRYAFEIRLVRRVAGKVSVAPPGRVFMDLPGLDAIAWLLTLEAEQSLGEFDPFRVSRSSCVVLQSEVFHYRGDRDLAVHFESLRRLVEFGVLKVDEGVEQGMAWSTWTPEPATAELLQDIGSGRDTPQRLMASAMLADESVESVLSHLGSAGTARATAASAREVNAIVHEVRNALVPVRVALSHVYRKYPVEESLRDRIDHGVSRVFAFVDERLRLLRTVDSPVVFSVGAALRDAVKAVINNIDLQVGVDWQARGPRHRIVEAMVELLRNARRASPEGTILVRTVPGTITVDDDGPGLPDIDIFAPGVTWGTGGTGHGLAIVRDIVGRDFRGSVDAESTETGARFVISIPVVTE